MEMYQDLASLPKTPIEPVVTIGNFDGVHRGHQSILATLKEEGARIGAPTMVITFYPHPRQVLRPDAEFHAIMSLRERMRRFWDLGIDHALVLRFDEDLAELTATEFVEEILWDALKVKAVHVGRDMAIGHKREGDIRFLASKGRHLGFNVGIVEPVYSDQQVISSSRIRTLILEGRMKEATRLLGRPHRVAGTVIKGDQRGRELGFPTANVRSDGAMLPPNGVYAAWVSGPEGERLQGVVNIGVRPTFKEGEAPLVEVHLLEFEGDLYGQHLNVELVDHIRAEARFEGPALLKRQITRDVLEAKRLLAG